MTEILISIFSFLIAISILVAFHELGHFWVARRLGVKVLRFSIGFGKVIWKRTDKHQTEFAISAIPLGGYVKMLDEREGDVTPQERQYAFNQKSVWARIAIVLAGPLFNFIFAILAYWAMFMIGISGWVPLIGDVIPDSIAARAGITVGEEVIRIEGTPIQTWQQVGRELLKNIGEKQTLEIQTKQADGTLNKHYLDLHGWEPKGGSSNLLKGLGLEPYVPSIPPVVDEVMPGEAALAAGMQAGDIIQGVNGKTIKDWQEMVDVITKSPFQPLEITIFRQNQTRTIMLTPRAKRDENGQTIGYMGVKVKPPEMPSELLRNERLGVIEAFMASVAKTGEFIALTFTMLAKMVTGQVGMENISGPITIAQGAGATATVGFQYFLGFLGVISISLGVLNLLPIPILDGGHLLFYVIEIITRKPVSERVQVFGFKVGMFLLLMLMSVAFYNDIIRLF